MKKTVSLFGFATVLLWACSALAAPAHAAPVATISPQLAALAKAEHGRAVLLLDVRGPAAAAVGGQATPAEALGPVAEAAHPLRWASAA
ncbi:MAG: hypothetical protein ACK5TK_00705, partial [Betaproteobacteria bacterium]